MSFSKPSSRLRSVDRSRSNSRNSSGASYDDFGGGGGAAAEGVIGSTPQSSRFPSSSYKPTTPSSLSNVRANKNSIPYNLLSNSPSSSSSSPSIHPAALNPSSPFNPASQYNHLNPSTSSPVFRRNAPFGSPGRTARSSPGMNGGLRGKYRQQSTGVGDDAGGDESRKNRGVRFIRERPLKERLASLPLDIYHSLSLSLSLYLSDLLYVPNNAYILSSFLHLLSLVSCFLSPDVSFGFGLPTFGYSGSASSSTKQKAMFGGSRDGLREIAKDQINVGWRGISVLLALLALSLSVYAAYLVSNATRSYSLWMREANHKLSASSTRLVDVPTLADEEDGESLKDRAITLLVEALKSLGRKIPVVSWFIPSSSDLRSDPDGMRNPKMITIQVWDPNEVLLRTCCLYSPLHSLIYLLLLSPLPIASGLSPAPNTPLGWVLLLSLMGLGSIQTLVLCLWFKEREKDKATLAGEVMFEYEQKFVIPRALPAVRDASTMTSQAEFIDPSDWRTTPSQSRMKTKPSFSSSSSSSRGRDRYGSLFEDRSYLAIKAARGGNGGEEVDEEDEDEE